MKNKQELPVNNLGLYRLNNFIGRTKELNQLKSWLDLHPVVAITGPSGAGKSTLASALAVSQAGRFEEGILWIGATGDTAFNFYDIVRDVEVVLKTEITTQPVVSWPLLVLQQLYGFSRLLVMDEVADADEDTIEKIITIIKQIGPGGAGRFILIGRYLPKPLQDLLGQSTLNLGGLTHDEVQRWIVEYQDSYSLISKDNILLHKITGGHPLALKLVAALWNTPDLPQLIELVSVHQPDDWEARLRATVTAVLAFLKREHPQAFQLLKRCSRASGGFSADTVSRLYWPDILSNAPLLSVLDRLLKYGMVMHNPQENRYFIHPLVRRYITDSKSIKMSLVMQHQYALEHSHYYLGVVQRCAKSASSQWHVLDNEWGNIRKALNFLCDFLKNHLGLSVNQAIKLLDRGTLSPLPANMDEFLGLIKDYMLALSNYIFWRHPPHGRKWMACGIIAARHLNDQHAEAIISNILAALSYFHQDYNTAHIWCNRSLLLFKAVKDYFRVIHITKDLGIILTAMGDFEAALDVYQEALTIATKHGSNLDQAAIQVAIASTYYRKKEYQQVQIWYEKVLALDLAEHADAWQGVCYNNMGLAIEATNNYQKAIDYYKEAATFHKKVNNEKGLSTAYSNLGTVYYQIGHSEEALEWYKRDMAIVASLGNWFDLAAILHNMGYVALELDDLQSAAMYFTRSRDIYRQFGQNELAEEEDVLTNTIRDRHTWVG